MGKLPSTKLVPGAKKVGDHCFRGTDAKAQVFLKARHIWKSSKQKKRHRKEKEKEKEKKENQAWNWRSAWQIQNVFTEWKQRVLGHYCLRVSSSGPILTVIAFQSPLAWVSLRETWLYDLALPALWPFLTSAVSQPPWPSSDSWAGQSESKGEVAQSCRLFATPWTVAYQAPPFMGFSRQGYWSGLLIPNFKLLDSLFLPPGLFYSQIFHLIDYCLPFESLVKYPGLKEPSRAADLKK